MALIPAKARVSTTSYLVPHLSQRTEISFPKKSRAGKGLDDLDAILLNPRVPGWGSSANRQKALLQQAKTAQWNCRRWDGGLELCLRKDKASQPNTQQNARQSTLQNDAP